MHPFPPPHFCLGVHSLQELFRFSNHPHLRVIFLYLFLGWTQSNRPFQPLAPSFAFVWDGKIRFCTQLAFDPPFWFKCLTNNISFVPSAFSMTANFFSELNFPPFCPPFLSPFFSLLKTYRPNQLHRNPVSAETSNPPPSIFLYVHVKTPKCSHPTLFSRKTLNYSFLPLFLPSKQSPAPWPLWPSFFWVGLWSLIAKHVFFPRIIYASL